MTHSELRVQKGLALLELEEARQEYAEAERQYAGAAQALRAAAGALTNAGDGTTSEGDLRAALEPFRPLIDIDAITALYAARVVTVGALREAERKLAVFRG
jgi:tetratricopeptide (TPR) repeat protein